jgi:hypothetical protein
MTIKSMSSVKPFTCPLSASLLLLLLLLYYIIIIIVIIIIEFLTSQLWLGNIHVSWDLVINRIRLGLIYSSKNFLQLNKCRELQIFAFIYMYSDTS